MDSGELAQQLFEQLRPVVDEYAAMLARSDHDLSAVGGAAHLAETVAAVLPRPNRLAARLGPVYTTGQLTRLLPGTDAAPITDQAVRNRVTSRRLIAVHTRNGRLAYPAHQFTVGVGRLEPREDVLELWAQLPTGGPLDELTLAVWLTGPRTDLNGASPLEWLNTHGLDPTLRDAAAQVRRRVAA